MTTSTPEKQDGLKILNIAIDKIRTTIAELGGVFNVQMAVKFHKYKKRNYVDNIFF
jgi:translation initiation factor 2 subunit 1